MELVVLNPVAVLGPVLNRSVSGSVEIIRAIIDRAIPGYPDLWIPIVDVRDVASAHVMAMTSSEAAGQRFIVSSGSGLKMKEIAAVVKEGLGARGTAIHGRSMPTSVVRIAGLFNKTAREIVPELGLVKRIDTEKARRLLEWQSRPVEETILATAESLLDKGVVTV